jgi:hypothetical protein
MIAGFDWWLLVVGIVGGAGLVWLIVADFGRRDDEVAADERAIESAWIAEAMTAAGRPTDELAVDEILELHRTYLRSTPPELDPLEDGGDPTGPTGAEAGEAAEATGPDEAIPPASAAGDTPAMERDRPEG